MLHSMETKTCPGCTRNLPIEQFRWDNKSKGVRKSRCGVCENARMRKYRAATLEQSRARDRAAYQRTAHAVYLGNLQRRYGITAAQAEQVAAATHCGLCGRPRRKRRLVVDHCHRTGINRGVICSSCNAGLGQFQDDPAVLRQAADYIERGGSEFFRGADDATTIRDS